MAASPSNEIRHVIIGDLIEKLVLAKVGDKTFKIGPRLLPAGVMLTNLVPVSSGCAID
jgi:hypothetical protein